MITVSVCMIVKNESAVLRRCLDSLAGIWDELIVVDTGSTDDTKQIAQSYTGQVYDFAWIDSFAAARNASLSKATCDYIYVADADEVLDEENRARFLALKQSLNPGVEVVEVAYENPDMAFNTTENFQVEYRPKLFRRLRRFEYMDPIHEVLRTEPTIHRSQITVHHMPTSSHAGRDLGFLGKLAVRGIRLSPRLEMMYARELLIAGTGEELTVAERFFSSILADITRGEDAHRQAACVLCRRAALGGDAEALLRLAAPLLADRPPAEILCSMGDYFHGIGNIPQAAAWYEAALRAEPELVAAASGRTPLNGLAACFERAGQAEQAEHCRRQAAAWTPEDQENS